MAQTVATPWRRADEPFLPTSLDVKLTETPPDDHHALMLFVGLLLGIPDPEEVEPIKHVGCGKVLAVR